MTYCKALFLFGITDKGGDLVSAYSREFILTHQLKISGTTTSTPEDPILSHQLGNMSTISTPEDSIVSHQLGNTSTMSTPEDPILSHQLVNTSTTSTVITGDIYRYISPIFSKIFKTKLKSIYIPSFSIYIPSFHPKFSKILKSIYIPSYIYPQ